MRKIDWGQTIAILANIGVLLGIVFLAMEIRDSRIAILAQTQDSVADGFLTLNLATITEPEIGLTFQKGLCEPEELTDLEAARFSMHMRALFNQFRRIYRLYEQGLLDEQAWKLTAQRPTSSWLPRVGNGTFRSTNWNRISEWLSKAFPKERVTSI